MTKRNNKQLEEVSLFVASLFNTEQDEYSKLVARLKAALGKTKEFDDALRVLTQIYEAKVELLNKIYDKIQDV